MIKADRCFVYWLHLPEHKDIFTEGYVGITTKTVDKRFQQHLWHSASGAKNNIINNAINKYGDSIICTTLLESNLTYCLEIERKLRSKPFIGWNINVGGDKPPMLNRSHTDETKRKIGSSRSAVNTPELTARCMRNIDRTKPRSKSACDRIKKAKQDTGGWRLPWSNKQLWLYADVVYEAMLDYPTKGSAAIQTVAKVPKTIGNILNIFKKIKNTSWNPNKDPEWLLWKSNTLKGILP